MPRCDNHPENKCTYICLENTCSAYREPHFTLFCEECLADEKTHKHMPNFISKIVERESKKWEKLFGDVCRLQDLVTDIYKKFGDLCEFLERDENGAHAKGSFAGGRIALKQLLDKLTNLYDSDS